MLFKSSYPTYPALDPSILFIDDKSLYSVPSNLIILSLPNTKSEYIVASFVLPHPLGPTNNKDIGLVLSL